MGRYPKGWCSICHHPFKIEIDKQILDGTPLSAIEGQFGINRKSLMNHRDDCITSDMAKAAEDEQEEAKERGEDLWTQLKELRTRTQAILDKVEAGASYKTALSAIRELTRLLELQARIQGQIDANRITINQQVNIYQSAEWDRVGEVLYEILGPYPELRALVAERLLKLSREAQA